MGKQKKECEDMGQKRKRSRKFYAIIILSAAAVLAVGLWLVPIPKYPSPEYSVDTYEELSERMDGLCYLPSADVLPAADGQYTVYLESRFSNNAVGYNMGFYTVENGFPELIVSCKSVDVLPEEALPSQTTSFYNEVGLCEGDSDIRFILDGFLYTIDSPRDAEVFSLIRPLIAQSIIDAQKHI